MRFARLVFLIAGTYGLILLVPQYFPPAVRDGFGEDLWQNCRSERLSFDSMLENPRATDLAGRAGLSRMAGLFRAVTNLGSSNH